jgi:serine/threonine protein phosphatase PrpC
MKTGTMRSCRVGAVPLKRSKAINTRMHPRAERQQTKMGHPAGAMLASYGITDCGRVRQANEDSFVTHADEGVFVVCDGMGGAAAGETASRLAAEAAAQVMRSTPHGMDAMRDAVRHANQAVYQRSRQDSRLEGMGTTLVAMVVDGTMAWVANVGDSRCYRWRNAQLERLTQDHSLVEEQIRIGRMTREQARRSPMQNVITRAVGTRSEVVADVQEVALEPGDVYLLASDGLTRDLPDQVLAATLADSAGDLKAAGTALISAANAVGGRDNITCVLVRIAA